MMFEIVKAKFYIVIKEHVIKHFPLFLFRGASKKEYQLKEAFFGSLHSPRAFVVWGTTIGNVVNKKAPINNINLLLLHPIVIGGTMGVIGWNNEANKATYNKEVLVSNPNTNGLTTLRV